MIPNEGAAPPENNTEAPQVTDTPQNAPEAPISDFMSNPDVLAYINKQVQEGIQKALQGTPPKASTADPTAEEKANFQRMTYRERLKLYQSNPQAYNKLAKGSI